MFLCNRFLFHHRDRTGRYDPRTIPILLMLLAAALLPASGCWPGQDGALPTAVPTQITLPAADVEVPVEIFANLIFVDVTVNGTGPYKFALDTGAALGLISSDVSAQSPANLLNSFTTASGFVGVTDQMQLFRVDSLLIGGMDFQNFSVAVQNVHSIFANMPFTVDGLIGIGLFRHVALTLDYPGKKIRVQTGVLPAPDDCTILPMTGGDLGDQGTYVLPGVPITVHGQAVQALLDSGNSGFLVLPDSFASLPFVAAPTEVSSFTITGPTTFLQGVLNGTVTLGCLGYDDPTLSVGGTVTSLGASGWQLHVVTIDQTSKSVRFAEP